MSVAERLDRLLVNRGLVASRSRAQELIARGRVRVAGRVATKPAEPVAHDVQLEVDDDPWVSRAARKLLGALDDAELAGHFDRGRALDAGASTGGFSQVLVERGCSRVYAVDVGHGQLAEPVRSDPRVLNREGCHVGELTLSDLDHEPVDWLVADLSFISLTQVLPTLLPLVTPAGEAMVMVKPQFEVGRARLGKNGVVTDPGLRAEAVAAVVACADALGWQARWQGPSRVPGPTGNVEFFVHLVADPTAPPKSGCPW